MTSTPADAAASDAEIVRLIQQFISAQTGEAPPEVVRLERASLGKSRENWSVDVRWGDGAEVEPLIVRRDPEGGLVDTDRGLEFELLRALEPSGLPTPKVRWLLTSSLKDMRSAPVPMHSMSFGQRSESAVYLAMAARPVAVAAAAVATVSPTTAQVSGCGR